MVDEVPIVGAGAVVGGGAGRGVRESHSVTELEQARVDRGVRQGDLCPEQVGRLGQQDRVAERLGCGGQGEQLGLGRELSQPEVMLRSILFAVVLDVSGTPKPPARSLCSQVRGNSRMPTGCRDSLR